ncbi:hypothetical protein [uncultured Spirosoma sp.]|uniref:hypothetical protein n=1 Tax=uncultured Spirosoma sp. TaxID=278208 RepID=UPI0025859B70|nr:hypothetical protein [uncultured Spirosoma sp.]
MTNDLPVSVQERLHRYYTLRDRVYALTQFYYQKYERARKLEKQDYYWQRYDRLAKFTRKRDLTFTRLIFNSRFGQSSQFVFGYVERARAEAWWRDQVADRQRRGREKFEKLHTYAPWFMSLSVGADYGHWDCEYCGRHFYHSPSTIKRAAKVVYECVCGHCTNQIIERDHGHFPYQ